MRQLLADIVAKDFCNNIGTEPPKANAAARPELAIADVASPSAHSLHSNACRVAPSVCS
jgi:hypothetical protein